MSVKNFEILRTDYSINGDKLTLEYNETNKYCVVIDERYILRKNLSLQLAEIFLDVLSFSDTQGQKWREPLKNAMKMFRANPYINGIGQTKWKTKQLWHNHIVFSSLC